MDLGGLAQTPFELKSFRTGEAQVSGPLAVVPIFGPDRGTRFVGPQSGLKLSQVRGYGNMELACAVESGVVIIPLHMGYIQDKAQNHCLCRSAFLGAGQKVMFEDACCVQQAQGGYLVEKNQWFFVLPLQLREKALELRGVKYYGKLWEEIRNLCTSFNLEQRGHLEQLISRKRAYLNQYQSRFELLEGQTGALFFLEDRLVGVEIAPTAAYFKEVWMPLVCFCYGTAAMCQEQHSGWTLNPPSLPGTTLAEIRASLTQVRQQRRQVWRENAAGLTNETFTTTEEEQFADLRLLTLVSANFAGQMVTAAGETAYVSLFARSAFANGMN
ncbi:MAG: hypothetical protein K1Y36_16325 [Blastocatellia bacterium]|nr:hypothetical protein [Blastocatellia bacterium]